MLRVWILLAFTSGNALFADGPKGPSANRLETLPAAEVAALATMRKGLKAPIYTEPSVPNGADAKEVAAEIIRLRWISISPKSMLTKLVPEHHATWLAAADGENVDAQFVCGVAAALGLGKNGGYKTAAEWFQKSSAGGHDHASVWYALSIIDGEGVPRDFSRGLELLRKISNKGYPYAQFQLAHVYCGGPQVADVTDPVEGIRLMAKVAGQGYPAAMSSLGYYILKGAGIKKDTVAAAEWFSTAVEFGSTDGMGNFGYCYLMGLGIAKDDKKAFEWMQRAASKGNVHATHNLANCYFFGRGVPADKSEGLRLFNRAADMGDKDSVDWIRKYKENSEYRPVVNNWVPDFSREAQREAEQAAAEEVRKFRSHIFR